MNLRKTFLNIGHLEKYLKLLWKLLFEVFKVVRVRSHLRIFALSCLTQKNKYKKTRPFSLTTINRHDSVQINNTTFQH